MVSRKQELELEKELAKLAKEEVVMHRHRRAFLDMEAMFREKEELLKHHENKVVQLKKEYGNKLAVLNQRERKEEELESLEKKNRSLLETKRLLEKRCKRLAREAREEAVLKDYLARGRKEVGRLHHDEARKRAELVELQRKVVVLKEDFDRAYKNAERITTFLKTKEAELRKVKKELDEADAKRRHVTSQITHHSISEVRIAIKRAEDHLSGSGRNFAKARQEYERIRKFYAHLPREEKRKVYGAIEAVKARIFPHFSIPKS